MNAADFAMSKMAANEKYNGHQLRKCIDYFCHLAKAPEAYGDGIRPADTPANRKKSPSQISHERNNAIRLLHDLERRGAVVLEWTDCRRGVRILEPFAPTQHTTEIAP